MTAHPCGAADCTRRLANLTALAAHRATCPHWQLLLAVLRQSGYEPTVDDSGELRVTGHGGRSLAPPARPVVTGMVVVGSRR